MDGFFDVFCGSHFGNITPGEGAEPRPAPAQTRPLTGSSAPVTAEAASLARNRITSASSVGVTHLVKSAFGMLARLAAVSMIDGSTALTVILALYSAATASVRRCAPDFDAARAPLP